MKPRRATVEIVLPCTRATEIRAAGEVAPMRGAPLGTPPILMVLREMMSQYSSVTEFN